MLHLLFSLFVAKLKLVEKTSNFLLLGVTLTSYMVLKFKQSKKFDWVQNDKNLKLKYFVKGSNFTHGNQFLPSFQILIF